MTQELLETIIAAVRDDLPEVRVCRMEEQVVIVISGAYGDKVFCLRPTSPPTSKSDYCRWLHSLPDTNRLAHEMLGQYIAERDETDPLVAALDE